MHLHVPTGHAMVISELVPWLLSTVVRDKEKFLRSSKSSGPLKLYCLLLAVSFKEERGSSLDRPEQEGMSLGPQPRHMKSGPVLFLVKGPGFLSEGFR